MADEMSKEIWAWRDLAGKRHTSDSEPSFPGFVIKPTVHKFIRSDLVERVREQRKALADRITNYLGNGGYFNPEFMEHDKVRDLLFDCRDHLDARTREGT